MTLQTSLFYLSAALILFCAYRTVVSPYIFRSALYLAGALSMTAVQYLLLEAEFVAIVQILVYVGAVVILIVFAVMLTAQIGEKGVKQSNAFVLPGLLLSGGLAWGLIKLFKGHAWPQGAEAVKSGHSNIFDIGKSLLNSYLLPFEIIGLLLFVALVGAVLIARKDPE
jgi:NADH:ubiquinone oxidoreductase subunit 6 (subunit J)